LASDKSAPCSSPPRRRSSRCHRPADIQTHGESLCACAWKDTVRCEADQRVVSLSKWPVAGFIRRFPRHNRHMPVFDCCTVSCCDVYSKRGSRGPFRPSRFPYSILPRMDRWAWCGKIRLVSLRGNTCPFTALICLPLWLNGRAFCPQHREDAATHMPYDHSHMSQHRAQTLFFPCRSNSLALLSKVWPNLLQHVGGATGCSPFLIIFPSPTGLAMNGKDQSTITHSGPSAGSPGRVPHPYQAPRHPEIVKRFEESLSFILRVRH